MLEHLLEFLRQKNASTQRTDVSVGEESPSVGAQIDDAQREARELMRLADDGCPNLDFISEIQQFQSIRCS